MNVLVIGYGSIGRRHVRNLAARPDVDRIIVHTAVPQETREGAGAKVVFHDAGRYPLADAIREKTMAFAVIANQTSQHLDAAITLAESGMDLFIEKPLSHNLSRIESLVGAAKRNGARVFVAYNMRYLPALRELRGQLTAGIVGAPFFAQIEAGQYLPDWRRLRPCRDSYSASQYAGGGVALDLSHEVDYMRYLFGDPLRWKTLRGRVADITIDSEDLFAGLYEFPGGFLCQVHLDYLQRAPRRVIRIVGSRGEAVCDLIGKRLEVTTEGRKRIWGEERWFDMGASYQEELQSFISLLKTGNEPDITIHDGCWAIRLLEDGHV